MHVIVGLNQGGAEQTLLRLVQEDQFNEHHIVSIMDVSQRRQVYETAGAYVESLGSIEGRIAPKNISKLRRLIKKTAPDVIQTWMYHSDLIGGLVAYASGKRNIVWGIRNSDIGLSHMKYSTLVIALACAATSYFIPKKIVSCSYRAADIHKKAKYCRNKILVIPNGYDMEQFQIGELSRGNLRREWQVTDQHFVFGLAARWHVQKDHRNVIEAFAIFMKKTKIPSKLVLFGSRVDAENDELRQLINNHSIGDHVIALGHRQDTPDIMSAVDVHVMSSFAGEAFPNVVAESMACGTPNIVTNVGDAAKIVGELGWVVPASYPKEMADAMENAHTLNTNSERWQALRTSCIERIGSEYSVSRMVGSYQDVWDSVSSV